VYDNLDTCNRGMKESQKQDRPWAPIDELSVVNSRSLAFGNLFDTASIGRRIAVTEQSFLSLVLPDSQVGDSICILHGGGVLFVLRKMSSSGSYALIGECYLQGWMDGASFRGMEGPIEEFTIC
jgi:hypothetical protein